MGGEETITIGTNVPKELAELLDCIVMANTHRSKSDILKEALHIYLEQHLDPAVLENAKKILALRKQTLNELSNK